MTLEEKQQEIIDEFAIYDDWMDKYQYIIDLGESAPMIDESKKTDDRLIDGCQAKVWLDAKIENGLMVLTADSNSSITKGIIGLLIRLYDNEKPEDIVKSDLHFISEIGLQEHLSPTRANGLVSMVKKIKILALSAIPK
ncbi:SufE family protein [Fluviicola sp.]|uniref:SufE family protein n=1 Tax=Fluviicola sp. TaxID=1917219 RepID=UPI003D2B1560